MFFRERKRLGPGATQNEKKEGGGVAKKGGITKRVGGPQAMKSVGVKKKKVSDLRLLIGGKPGVRPTGPVLRDAREKLSKTQRIPDAREKIISRASAVNTDMVFDFIHALFLRFAFCI